MTDDLRPGLHEALITEALLARIERAKAAGWLVEWKAVDDSTLAAILARHIHDRALERMEGIPASVGTRRSQQVHIANKLLEVLARNGSGNDLDPVVGAADLLLEVSRRPEGTPRPGIPLRDSTLLVNGHRDLQIGSQVSLEVQSADRVDLLSAFVRFAGVRLIRRELEGFLLHGGQMRVICTVYTGSTEKRALDELVGLGAKVKVSYETSQTRLHAKAWLFERNSGFHTAYVGSSNLTHSALVDGLEWNVRATEVDNPAIIARVRATFEQYWNDPEFQSYDPRVDGDRLQAALDAERGSAGIRTGSSRHIPLNIHVEPKPFQTQILEGLAAERARGHYRNLVVAPTGTGKTWVSAFDYKRLRRDGHERLLFVAHRNEILQQSQRVFQVVLGDDLFGERFIAGERPTKWTHVFASIQSIHRYIDDIKPDQFDVVIVDEFHHAEAETYTRLLDHLRPKVLVGLTATPERADGRSVFHYFDDRVASEMRLWEALDQGLLCPFHYLGVADGTDLRSVRFERGRYVVSDLEGVLTGDHVRANRILKSMYEWVHEPHQMRALGFCAGVNHARFMASQFTSAGLPAEALDGDSDPDVRLAAIARLRRGEIRAIFTVDIFNEGVDIPEVDTLLLLRPTESATIFLQQLGRGLRWAEGKSVLTVLDFIGQSNAEYRFDVRYRALIGGTRRQVEKAVEHGFPLMPPGCAIRLDEIAQKIVLENLRTALRNSKKAVYEDVQALGSAGTLKDFVRHSSLGLQDLYYEPGKGTTFTSARRRVGLLRGDANPSELRFGAALGKLLHVDDMERYEKWRSWLRSDDGPSIAAPGTRNERLQWMLFAALGQVDRSLLETRDAFREFWRETELRRELVDLLDVLQERVRLDARALEPAGIVPIHSHAWYNRDEIVAAYGVASGDKLRELREGVLWVPDHATDLFFVTLNKDESDYSPTTLYQDYAISPTLFHWESQSRTATASPTGQRYVHHRREGSHVVLFVRENKRDERGIGAPYLCLGQARYVRHKSDRPMQIVWELERPMPGEILGLSKLAAG